MKHVLSCREIAVKKKKKKRKQASYSVFCPISILARDWWKADFGLN